MSTGTVLAIAVLVAVVAIAVLVGLLPLQRRRRLQRDFGPEYGRAVKETGSRKAAERELRDRRHRYEELDIRELPEAARHEYTEQWNRVQEHFVDEPAGAVQEADELLTRLMHDRGYPTEGYEERLRHLSVAHGRTLDHYRKAHEVRTRDADGGTRADTEELRGAMVHYRALFEDLLVPAGTDHSGRTAAARERA
ncbi:hypothetical protein [Streptomyces sp. NPDC097619]|uniref:hypothetical protein n=1 Tax=Streptomyces sp. NPDC097619 TaxID=3157228 RepID=UPI00331A2E44